ncbi:hypothetical protein [Streptomyces sp. NPDC058991]|uniref:hypothetical protein n=1 Tax=unclassified Streptomyces TaxID=2593676 RepID=UPI0036C5B629
MAAAAGIATLTGGTTLISGRTVTAESADAKAPALRAAVPARGGEGVDEQEYRSGHADDRGWGDSDEDRSSGSEDEHSARGEGDNSDKRQEKGPDGHDEQSSGSRDQGGAGADDEHARKRVPCDPNALIAAITEANNDGGGTLSLAEKCTYTLTANQDGNGLPEIIQPITIHGNGATVARAANADRFRFFQVSAGGDLELRHLTLTRGKAPEDQSGGAILVTPAGRLDLDHTTLTHNTVTDDDADATGGAIHNEGITRVRNTTLSRNTAANDDGGAIHNVGALSITSSELTHNTAVNAGALSSTGTVTISKSLISHNSAGDAGGILLDEGVMEIVSSKISHNTAGEGDGGGIVNSEGALYVRGSTISHNTAFDDAGGLSLVSDTVIEDSTIKGNVAVGGDGGGIIMEGDVAIRGSQVTENQALGDGASGGGIFLNESGADLTLTDSKVTKNLSDAPAGGIHNEGTVTTFGKIRIIDNVPTNCLGSPNPVPSCFG